MTEKRNQAQDEAVETEGGQKFMERVEDGVVVRGADDDPKDAADRADLTPHGGVKNAPQNWDPHTQTFSAGAEDPNADNVDVANEAQTDPGPRTQNLTPKKGGEKS